MVLYGYPQDLPGFMKLLNNYIEESGKKTNFSKKSGNDKTGVAFTETQEKDTKDKRKYEHKGRVSIFPLRKSISLGRRVFCPRRGTAKTATY